MEPPADPRIEAAKKWTERAKLAARKAYAEALSAGGDREAAVEAGHKAGLQAELKARRLKPSEIEFVMKAATLFGIAAPAILKAEAKRPAKPSRSARRGQEDNPPADTTNRSEATQARSAGERAGKP